MKRKYVVHAEENEVLGQVLIALLQNLRQKDGVSFLQKYGIEDIDPEAWYPLQVYLDVFNDIMKFNPGEASANFVSSGMQVIDTAVFPPDFDSLPFVDIMRNFNAAYRLNNRGPEIGEMVAEFVDDKHVQIVSTIPMPDDFNYGVLYAAARRFLPPGTSFTVYYDPEIRARDQGGDVTITHIRWN